MARVTASHRRATLKRTGSSKYPMETASQVRSAIRLRHHGKSYSSSRVLSRVSRAVSRLRKAHKISAGTAKAIRNSVKRARARDKKR